MTAKSSFFPISKPINMTGQWAFILILGYNEKGSDAFTTLFDNVQVPLSQNVILFEDVALPHRFWRISKEFPGIHENSKDFFRNDEKFEALLRSELGVYKEFAY
jgi:hypothetical protein